MKRVTPCDIDSCAFNNGKGQCGNPSKGEACSFTQARSTLESIIRAQHLCALCMNPACKNAVSGKKPPCSPVWCYGPAA